MTEGKASVPLPRRGDPDESDTGTRTSGGVSLGIRSGGVRTRAADAPVGAPPWLRAPDEVEADHGAPSTNSHAGPQRPPSAGRPRTSASATRTSRPRPVAPMPRPPGRDPGAPAAACGPAPAGPATPPPPPPSCARPRVDVEDGIIGLSRWTRSRVGSRLFTLFFVAVFALILGHLVFVLVHG